MKQPIYLRLINLALIILYHSTLSLATGVGGYDTDIDYEDGTYIHLENARNLTHLPYK